MENRPSASSLRIIRSYYTIIAMASWIQQTEPFSMSSRTLSSRSASSFASCSLSGRSECLYQCEMTQILPAVSASFSKRIDLVMNASANKNERTRSFKTSSGSSLLDLHNERLKTAGRRGTKKFVDPNKLFIGNLAFDATENDVAQLFAAYWRIPVESVREKVESIKIIRDWKTGQSKGYGFLMFYNAMDATSVMMNMKGDKFKIKGRPIRFDQGKKKGVDEDEREKKKEKKKRQKLMMKDLDEEGRTIHSALEGIERTPTEREDEADRMSEDDMITFMEKGGLRGVIPLTEELAGYLGKEGLYEDDEVYAEYFNENDFSDEAFDEDDDGDDDNFVYDGVFEEIYNPNEYETLTAEEEEKRIKMNREQRRAADKRRKKRKLPFKGFGKP